MVSGVTQLKDGAMQLSEGLQQFNRDGIQKLVNLLQNDVGDLSARVQATIDVSKDYRSFAGISDDAEGQVKFIYRTGRNRLISKEEQPHNKAECVRQGKADAKRVYPTKAQFGLVPNWAFAVQRAAGWRLLKKSRYVLNEIAHTLPLIS